MEILKAIIVDDEANARNTIKSLLQKLETGVQVLAEAANAEEAKNLIHELHPNVVFLDIQMPGKTGFQLLQEIHPVNFDVIFTTAYHEYAINAFKFSAIDYLLKPIDPQELLSAINKAKEKRKTVNTSQLEILQQLLQQTQTSSVVNKIALPTAEGIHFIEVENIIWCESLTGYTKFHLQNAAPIITSKTIGDYEELLSSYNFIRVHQSSLINLRHVKKYVKGEGGQVWMSNNDEIEVSRRKKDNLLASLGKMK